MTGVDWGSKEVKWFNGKEFGLGFPSSSSAVLGLSSYGLLTKEATFPLCKGRELEKLVLNEVVADLGVEEEEVAVAFCPIERQEKGCTFLLFIEKREVLKGIPDRLKESSLITSDLIGGSTAFKLLYGEGEGLIVDAGSSKIAVYRVLNGVPVEVEVIRKGFNEVEGRELLDYIGSSKAILVGGGALSGEFKERLKGIDFQVPNFPPFGEESPLYFNAFGLYNFKSATCRALFQKPSIFSSEFLEKHGGKLKFLLFSSVASLLLITASELIRFEVAKRDYLSLKSEIRKELSKIAGEEILIPQVQIPEKVESLKELQKLLRLKEKSVLTYLKAISDSVNDKVEVLEVKGSSSLDRFTVVGRAESEDGFKEFIDSLKKRFKEVSVSLREKGKFKVNLKGVKVGAE
ncbi:hypothetical protein [Thermovibrio sp.]